MRLMLLPSPTSATWTKSGPSSGATSAWLCAAHPVAMAVTQPRSVAASQERQERQGVPSFLFSDKKSVIPGAPHAWPWSASLHIRLGEGLGQSLGQLHRILVGPEMHEQHVRLVVEHVAVQRRHLDAV